MSNQPNLQALEQQARAAMMADNMLSTYRTYRLIFTISTSAILVGYIIAIGIIMLTTGDDCSDSGIHFRSLIYAYLALFSIQLVYTIVLELFMWRGLFTQFPALSKIFNYLLAVIGLVFIGMFIVSCIAIFGGYKCKDEFEAGYFLVCSIAILNSVLIVLVVVSVCCCMCFLIRLKRHGEKEDDSGIGENNNI